MTDAEWAVALAREAAMALFVVRAPLRQHGGGDAPADPGRPGSIEPDGRESRSLNRRSESDLQAAAPRPSA